MFKTRCFNYFIAEQHLNETKIWCLWGFFILFLHFSTLVNHWNYLIIHQSEHHIPVLIFSKLEDFNLTIQSGHSNMFLSDSMQWYCITITNSDSFVWSFLITDPHRFLVALVALTDPSPTNTWHTNPQLAILTTFTLTPRAGRPDAPRILLKLHRLSLHRAVEDERVTPPAMWLSMSTSPGRSCCIQLHASHAITSWRSLQKSWSCTHTTSNTTHPAALTTTQIFTGPKHHSSILVTRKRRSKRGMAEERCRWGRLISHVSSQNSTSQHTSTSVTM